MSNYNLVNEGIGIQARGGNVELILKGYSLDGKEGAKYRQAIYPGLTAWMRKGFIMRDNGLISEAELKTIQSVVKEDAIKRINAIRAAHVIQQTTQIAEVVVDEIALLKAELAAKTQECANVVRELNVTKTELTVSEAKVNRYESIFASLTKRTVVIGNVITKVYTQVAQSVGI